MNTFFHLNINIQNKYKVRLIPRKKTNESRNSETVKN